MLIVTRMIKKRILVLDRNCTMKNKTKKEEEEEEKPHCFFSFPFDMYV